MLNSTQKTGFSHWRQAALLALMVIMVGAISFGAVAGWVLYGEAIFRQAVADGWALCF